MIGVLRRVALAGAVAAGIFLSGPPAAGALSPWWHLSSGARPGVIAPGTARSEVQEIRVSATEGTLILVGPEFKVAFVPWNATAAEMQAGLEAIYGAGNVEVAGGPGDETGSKPYTATFVGELADVPVKPVETLPFLLGCGGASGAGCTQTATVTEKTKGRPDGVIALTAANLGNADVNAETSTVSIADRLPAGLRATVIEGVAGAGTDDPGPVACSRGSLSCTFTGALPPYDQIEVVIGVVVEGASSGALNEVRVSGGATPPAAIERPVSIGGGGTPFGTEDYELRPEADGGGVDTQAGSHPFQLTTTFTLNQTAQSKPVQLAKDLNFKLPAGLVGNPTAVPQCKLAQFNAIPSENEEAQGLNLCPARTAIGVAIVTINGEGRSLQGPTEILSDFTFTVPIFNLEPSAGEPARFGFTLFRAPVYLDTSVRTGGDYGVTVHVSNITQTAAFVRNEVIFWGTPGDSRHDGQRGWGCLLDARYTSVKPPPCDASTEAHPQPLLTMPTTCSGSQLQTSVEADSWAQPGDFTSTAATQPLPTLDGCNRLPFAPTISVAPDSQAASTPTGLTVGVHVPQDLSLNAAGLSEADVKDTTVTLPAGVALNPAAADGLQSCGEAQVALSADEPAGCPESSKVATVEIKSPLLPNPLTGAVYLAAQNANPFGSLVAMYLVAQDPVSGVLVKVAGEVKLDPSSGQLVAVFDDTPQLPFEDLKLHFFGGSRAPLGTPAACGAYTTGASIAPWSGNPPAESSSTFEITSGPNGSACASPLPFTPTLTAGTTNIQAGGLTPFTMTVSREDGQQNIQQFQLHMPPGLSGLLTGVELCGEAQANAGTCGPNSLIGETTVSVGLGGNPFSVTGGRVYITGPYEGAPFGISVAVPAKAGPYDLGTVVVRGRIEVDPTTSALTVTTNSPSQGYAIPRILDGIPLQIKHVNFITTRSAFTFNPTNCDPMSVTGSVQSVEGPSSNVAVPFQVTNCAILDFKPHFAVSTSGRTSRQNGASLHVKLTYPAAPFGTQANIHSVRVELPKALPSRLTTLNHACLDAVFSRNPAECPSQSRVGFAKAVTPLIPVPLEGPAYFVSHGSQKFPELVVVLQGYGVTVDLQGETFISKAGITSSTFKSVPDVPVGSFELTLPEGPYSALTATGNLCTANLTMPTTFEAQNGAQIKQNTPVEAQGCAYRLIVVHRSVHRRTMQLKVSVPQAGALTATGRGISEAAETASGPQTLTLELRERHAGRLRTRVLLRFTPTAGRQRKILRKSVTATFP